MAADEQQIAGEHGAVGRHVGERIAARVRRAKCTVLSPTLSVNSPANSSVGGVCTTSLKSNFEPIISYMKRPASPSACQFLVIIW